ncbi:MAG: iron uptake protein [Myxococcales bacterium]|nr:MAG: iron uptake protein [Myxococcales bacterium]
MNSAALPTSHVVSRVAASLLGGYAFVWGFTSLGIALGVAAGTDYHEAETLMFLLAFLVFLAAFCWAFVAASLTRVWAVLAGGGALMTGVAWLVTRNLL